MISSKPSCPPEDWQKYYASDHTWPSGLAGDCWLFRGSKGLDTRLRGAWRAMPCQPMLPTTTSAQVHVEIKSHLDHFSSHSLIKIPMKFNASIMHYDEKLIANVYLSYTSKDRLSPAIRNWKFTLNETTVAILRTEIKKLRDLQLDFHVTLYPLLEGYVFFGKVMHVSASAFQKYLGNRNL